MIDNKTLVSELIFHLKKVGFVKHLSDYINNEIPLTIFPIAKREGLTINEWVSDVEDDTKQHTVLTTTRLSYDGVKSFFVYKLNNYLSLYNGARLKILKLKEIKDEEMEKIEGKSFDVIFEFNGNIVIIEIKVTQSDSGFTGATHTTSKADIFLLISLKINRNKKVVEDSDYVEGIFSMLINLGENSWKGEAKNNSSYTQLRFLSDIDYSGNIISGKFKKNKKYCKIIFEKV